MRISHELVIQNRFHPVLIIFQMNKLNRVTHIDKNLQRIVSTNMGN